MDCVRNHHVLQKVWLSFHPDVRKVDVIHIFVQRRRPTCFDAASLRVKFWYESWACLVHQCRHVFIFVVIRMQKIKHLSIFRCDRMISYTEWFVDVDLLMLYLRYIFQSKIGVSVHCQALLWILKKITSPKRKLFASLRISIKGM